MAANSTSTDRETPTPADWEALLRWYAEAGVDIAIDEDPADRFALPPSPEPVEPVAEQHLPRRSPFAEAGRTATPILPQAIAPSDEIVREARHLASSATDLEALRAALEGFEGCNLRLTANRLVFCDGNPQARIMLVGEAPGKEEDLQGLPFVGRSGQLLDRMLASIGLDRTSVYIANVVPWRPPGNRTPTPQETATCRPFIDRQIQLVDPDFLICLGNAAAKELMGTSEGILRLRGRWRDFDTGTRVIKAMATLHPAYLLRQPLQKRLSWRDLLTLQTALNGPGQAPSEASPEDPQPEAGDDKD